MGKQDQMSPIRAAVPITRTGFPVPQQWTRAPLDCLPRMATTPASAGPGIARKPPLRVRTRCHSGPSYKAASPQRASSARNESQARASRRGKRQTYTPHVLDNTPGCFGKPCQRPVSLIRASTHHAPALTHPTPACLPSNAGSYQVLTPNFQRKLLALSTCRSHHSLQHPRRSKLRRDSTLR